MTTSFNFSFFKPWNNIMTCTFYTTKSLYSYFQVITTVFQDTCIVPDCFIVLLHGINTEIILRFWTNGSDQHRGSSLIRVFTCLHLLQALIHGRTSVLFLEWQQQIIRMSEKSGKWCYPNDLKFLDRHALANSADPDQTAPRGVVWSVIFWSVILFVILGGSLFLYIWEIFPK